MKRKVLAILVPAMLMAGAANAAEIYNKNGNKVDLYGKVDARHTFSDNPVMTAMKPTCRLVSKAKPRSLAIWWVTASGNINHTLTILKAPVPILYPSGVCWPEVWRIRFI
jgi:hypothetical protein